MYKPFDCNSSTCDKCIIKYCIKLNKIYLREKLSKIDHTHMQNVLSTLFLKMEQRNHFPKFVTNEFILRGRLYILTIYTNWSLELRNSVEISKRNFLHNVAVSFICPVCSRSNLFNCMSSQIDQASAYVFFTPIFKTATNKNRIS